MLVNSTKDTDKTPQERLLEKGEEQGFITLEDILQEYPQAELHVDEISEVYTLLQEEGISILDEEGDTIEGILGKKAQTEEEPGRAVDFDEVDAESAISLYFREAARHSILTAQARG